MKIAIHQPNYLPYIGFFQKMVHADVFVLLDNVQYSKDSYTQRVKIRTRNGWMWLTIPIEKSNNFKKISQITLSNYNKWRLKHKLSIIANYSKTPFFDKEFIDRYYELTTPDLVDFNEFGILYLQKKFKIKTKILRATQLNLDNQLAQSDLLIAIVKELSGSTYISGSSGRKYLNEKKFYENDIQVQYFEPKIQGYTQRWPSFQPFMSAIDLSFNIDDTICEKIVKK
jgi:hypothetical protein